MGFKKFIIENHPDPDSVFGIDKYDFEQIVVLAENFAKKEVEAINYTPCSLQLPDVDKRKEIEEEAYTLNLQNLSGREDFEEAFRLGIMTGIDETIEYIESKAIV